MKDKVWKWIKHNWAVACLVIAVLILAVSGSFAAYTSFNSVKRVVSTGSTKNETRFSSNYLSLVNLSEKAYPAKRIFPQEVKAENNVTGYTFTVQVCNYILGNEEAYNLNTINYTFTVELIPNSGSSLPDGIGDIQVNNAKLGTLKVEEQKTLSGGSANTDSYKFNIPLQLKDKVKFKIVAKPSDTTSQNATNGQMLAAVISLSDLIPTEDWTGKFIDVSNKSVLVDGYDAFNYEISGNGIGTVTLSWPESLQISPWFLEDLKDRNIFVTTDGNSSCIFEVNGDTTAFQLQFFRNPAHPISPETKFSELENQVTVSFSKTS